MDWSSRSSEIAAQVAEGIPPFVRGMVSRIIRRSAERLAEDRGSRRVEEADVVAAYLHQTPAPMQPLLRQRLSAAGIAVEKDRAPLAAETPRFPIGEAMTREECETFLTRALTVRVATAAQGVPYITPVSFVFLNGCVYFHSISQEGRRARNLRENPRVCLEWDEYDADHLSYRSVIVEGVADVVAEREEIIVVMQALARKFPAYAPGDGHNAEIHAIIQAGWEVIADAVIVYRVRPERLSGKKKGILP